MQCQEQKGRAHTKIAMVGWGKERAKNIQRQTKEVSVQLHGDGEGEGVFSSKPSVSCLEGWEANGAIRLSEKQDVGMLEEGVYSCVDYVGTNFQMGQSR